MSDDKNSRLPTEHFKAKEDQMLTAAPGGRYQPEDTNAFLGDKIKTNKKDTELRTLIQRVTASTGPIWSDGLYDPVLDGDELEQTSLVNGKPVGIVPSSVNTATLDKGSVRGTVASRLMRKALGTGKDGLISFDHSGFTIRVGEITPRERFALMVMLREQRDNVGMQTKGQLWTTDDVHIQKLIVDFCLDKVIDTSILDWTPSLIRKLMVPQDIIALQNGVLDFMFPEGIPVIQECINSFNAVDPCDWSTLSNIERLDQAAKLTMRRTFVRNRTKIDSYCLEQLAKPMRTITEAEVISYQDRLKSLHANLDPIIVSDTNGIQISVVPRWCSIDEYFDEGLATIADARIQIDNIFNDPRYDGMSDKQVSKERQERIDEYLDYIGPSKFTCWIEKIILKTEEGTFSIAADEETGRSDLIKNIEEIGQDSIVREAFINAMREWLVSNQWNFTGIQNFRCPKCRASQDAALHSTEPLIPISITMYFFTTIVASRMF